jgi:nucleoside-diphosphate-sugar epimerase
MQILITGGTGFIGSRLAIRCLEDGHQVRVLGRKNTPWEERNLAALEERGIEVVLGSVTDPDSLKDAVNGVDVVYHLAAAQHESNVPDQYFWDINVTGTRYMLEASVAAGVKRFVHGSTIGVYGSAASGEITPDTPVAPDNIYGITKREGESLALSYRDRLNLTVVRISETYGPGDSRLLKLFKGIKKGYFFKIGSGDNLHHLIFVDDLVEGFVRTAAEEDTIGEAYVIAGGEPITTDEMIDTIREALDAKLLPFRAPMWPFLWAGRFFENTMARVGMKPPLTTRRMDFFRKTFYFNQAKTAALIGTVATTSFAEGTRQTMEWYMQNGML